MKAFKVAMLPILALAFIGLTSFKATEKKKSAFKVMSFATAKRQAIAENKILVAEFMASWCSPCRWMDETTYANDDVKYALNASFIPVKIDIDDFDGGILAKNNKVKVLPTLIFFDKKGREIKRYEETFGPTRLLEILSDIKSNYSSYSPPKPPYNTTVKDGVKNKNTKEIKDAPKINKPETSKKRLFQQFESKTKESKSKNFGLQTGVFSSQENAINEANRLLLKTQEEVNIVKCIWKDNAKVYKVLIGNYKNISIAQQQQIELKSKNILPVSSIKLYKEL